MDFPQQKELNYKRLMAEARGHGMQLNEEFCNSETPWGAYLRVHEASLNCFIDTYWFDVKDQLSISEGNRLDPKLLLVAPGKRLSLQYHHRRTEHWRVLEGPVKIVLGEDGASLTEKVYNTGDIVKIPCSYWHRIAGLGGWAVIAELWEHIDPENPSDEDDIVRVEDDFSRKTG